jgi:hypothetical protein
MQSQLETLVNELRLEKEQLTAKVQVLKQEAEEISLKMKFEVSHASKILQIFLKDLEGKIAESNKTTGAIIVHF